MPFNGTGTFEPIAPPAFPAVPGDVIDADHFNVLIKDLIDGLSKCFLKNGESSPEADLKMGGRRLRQLANAAADTDAVNLQQVTKLVTDALASNGSGFAGTLGAGLVGTVLPYLDTVQKALNRSLIAYPDDNAGMQIKGRDLNNLRNPDGSGSLLPGMYTYAHGNAANTGGPSDGPTYGIFFNLTGTSFEGQILLADSGQDLWFRCRFVNNNWNTAPWVRITSRIESITANFWTHTSQGLLVNKGNTVPNFCVFNSNEVGDNGTPANYSSGEVQANFFNLSTGIATAPQAGWYTFAASCYITGGDAARNVFLVVKRKGSVIMTIAKGQFQTFGGNDIFHQNLSCARVRLAVGDQVHVLADAGDGGDDKIGVINFSGGFVC